MSGRRPSPCQAVANPVGCGPDRSQGGKAPVLMSNDEDDSVPLVPGRSCGDCSLCCKLLHVEEFNKPAGKWCVHCAPGRGGCTVHETRPQVCRSFYCSWMTSPGMGPEWRPNTCNMVMYLEGGRNVFGVLVDPSDPAAGAEAAAGRLHRRTRHPHPAQQGRRARKRRPRRPSRGQGVSGPEWQGLACFPEGGECDGFPLARLAPGLAAAVSAGGPFIREFADEPP